MTDPLHDLDKILSDARQRWEREQRAKRTNIATRIGHSIPWWLVVIAFVAFALSVPHTVEVFSRATPIVGALAPFLVELGLLYGAANRYRLKQIGKRPGWIVIAFELFVAVASVFVNTAGSLIAVVSNTPLAEMPIDVILSRLHELPVLSQVALVIVPFAGLMIPTGTWVAGEGLARLFLEDREQVRDNDDLWAMVAPNVEYDALYNALVTRGVPPGRAARRANAYIVGKHYNTDTRTVASEPSVSSDQTHQTDRQPSDVQTNPPDIQAYSAPRQRNPNAARDAARLLQEHPEWLEMSVRRLEEQTGIDKSAWWTAKKNHNGVEPGDEKQ